MGLVLDHLGLRLHPDKTRVVFVGDGHDGFDFLGFHCRKVESWRRPGRRFLWMWPGRRAMERVRERIKAITSPRPRLLEPLQHLIVELNPVLRGWAVYFRVGNSSRHFTQIDRYVHERLALFLSKKACRSGRNWKGRVPLEWDRPGAHGNADSDPVNGLGKPGAGEPHARFDEGRLETEPRSRDRSACNEVRGQRRTKAATAPVSHSTVVPRRSRA